MNTPPPPAVRRTGLPAAEVERPAPWVRDVALINRARRRGWWDICVARASRVPRPRLGNPAVGNVHEVARGFEPTSRVVYVDYEPVAVQHARELLKNDDNTAVVLADVRNTRSVPGHPDVTRLIDVTGPVGLPISTMSRDEAGPETDEQLTGLLRLHGGAGERVHPREHATTESWFAGTEPVEPGLVLLDSWRPDSVLSTSPARLLGYGGVGRIVSPT